MSTTIDEDRRPGSKRDRSKWLLMIPIIIVVLLLLFRQGEEIPECPHYWDFSEIGAPQDTVKLKTIQGDLLSGPQAQTNVPEYNDCQQLITVTGKTARYDELYAVFAHDNLDDPLNEIQQALESGEAFPMVEILSLGGSYPKLELKPGFNCLFVYKEADTWRARLGVFGPKEQDCHSPKPKNEVLAYPALSIKRTTPSMNRKDYPPVARWEWDIGSNTQVIGFMCLDGWCEVGESGHDPETGPDLTGTMSDMGDLSNSPVLKVKGWYDEQRLSPATHHRWKFSWQHWSPSSVVGTIVPAPGLDQLDATSFNKTWQPIAYVNLSEPSKDYYKAARFVPMAGDKVTTISLCKEDWGAVDAIPSALSPAQLCQDIPQKIREQAGKCITERTAPAIHWWAKSVVAGGNPDPTYWCIVRRIAPPGVSVPGTARWRWLASDEETWGRCGGACCSGH